MIKANGNGAPRQRSAAQDITPTCPENSTPPAEIVVDAVYEYNAHDFRSGSAGIHPDGALVRLRLPARPLTASEMNAAATLAYRASRVQVVGSSHDVADLVDLVRVRCAELAQADDESQALMERRLAEMRQCRDYFRAQGDTVRAGWWAKRMDDLVQGAA